MANFTPELSEVILETKYLEKLGYAVPDIARGVALQEEKFSSYQNSLTTCLQRYHSVLGKLNDAEVRLCTMLPFLVIPH